MTRKIKAPDNKLVLRLMKSEEKTESGFYVPTTIGSDVKVGKLVAGSLPIDVPDESKWDVYFKKSQSTEIKVDDENLYVVDVDKILLYIENV